MKYTWTEKDIIAGRWVCKNEKPSYPDRPGNEHFCRDCYKLGFDPSNKGICLICITDGMILPPLTHANMAAWLNTHEMIPMPHKWLLETMVLLRDWYEGH